MRIQNCKLAVGFAALAFIPLFLAITAASPAAAAADAVKIRLGYVPVTGAGPIFVLTGEGWARQAGLDITPVEFQSGPNAVQAFASGSLDVLTIGIAPIAVARAKGLDVEVVATTSNGGSGLVGTPRLVAAFAAANGDAAKAFAAFHHQYGRPVKLGTLPSGGAPAVALSYWLDKITHVAPADVTVVQMGIDAVQQAVLTGAVDGGTLLQPGLGAVLQRDPALKVLADEKAMLPFPQGLGVAVSGAFLRAHPDSVVALIALIRRADDLCATHPDQAAPFVQKVLGGGLLDVSVVTQALASLSYEMDPRKAAAATKSALAYQVEIGDFDKAPSLDGLFDTSFYDRAMAVPEPAR